jgi:hypothetical protein
MTYATLARPALAPVSRRCGPVAQHPFILYPLLANSPLQVGVQLHKYGIVPNLTAAAAGNWLPDVPVTLAITKAGLDQP